MCLKHAPAIRISRILPCSHGPERVPLPVDNEAQHLTYCYRLKISRGQGVSEQANLGCSSCARV